ncbi:SAM-dependent methyltransferase [Actinoplanes sp. SE50]|uniref:class I SAM-dependent methyltransferase n=1 Tax=unclassified Actinoplanes TaxID=2626549 RepID=UPI00023ECDE3|nr:MULTISPECIES: class I SAM-dependent methyltransferase [unclassified Actinoplanes]AEV81582.1 SAM-dependent methyltransferase [Actinoplanes sp. SE50/110]ATO79983.1 SAM-dependent methyltransferase [Actinoplanes sp. SE50]SLL97386.1 SAM-dependent methyltransferase [Actinoplanes sp. SE50/110]
MPDPVNTPEHWTEYNAHQGDRAVRDTCRIAMDLAGPGAGRTAVDLGCGAGIETRALLDAGWRVSAYDSEPAMLAGLDHPWLTAHRLRFEAIGALPPADLVYAGYALPWQTRGSFDRLWTLIRTAVRPGGRIAVDLFGVRDAWSGNPAMTFLTAAEARSLADGLVIDHWHEQDETAPAYRGPKHWHVFTLVAHRPEN